MNNEKTLFCQKCSAGYITIEKVKFKDVIWFGVYFGLTIILIGSLLALLSTWMNWEKILNGSITGIRVGVLGLFLFPFLFWFSFRNKTAYLCNNCQHK
ncbi:hypothetical protein [Shimazuella kribbensis]|uniref:hypothetical protein n=1 Tax=Shimazuella kribbensis TaxID=139808 RepID=UPI00041FA02D|nr:hypothetical protein [Shimazuella kribbensis]